MVKLIQWLHTRQCICCWWESSGATKAVYWHRISLIHTISKQRTCLNGLTMCAKHSFVLSCGYQHWFFGFVFRNEFPYNFYCVVTIDSISCFSFFHFYFYSFVYYIVVARGLWTTLIKKKKNKLKKPNTYLHNADVFMIKNSNFQQFFSIRKLLILWIKFELCVILKSINIRKFYRCFDGLHSHGSECPCYVFKRMLIANWLFLFIK